MSIAIVSVDHLYKVIEKYGRFTIEPHGAYGCRFSIRLNRPLIGYKKANLGFKKVAIVKLQIPSGAIVISGGYSDDFKLRTNKAKVISIEKIRSKRKLTKAYSMRSSLFIYKVGKTVTPDRAFDRALNTCSSGIHFFLSRNKAVRYR